MLHCNITLDGITHKGQEQFGDKTATQNTATLIKSAHHTRPSNCSRSKAQTKQASNSLYCARLATPGALKNNGDVFPNIPVIVIAF
jgi:membrane protease subunit (stomatin/prohibitin family)